MIRNFDDLIKFAKERGPKKIAVACADDTDVLKAIENARTEGIAEGILVGDKELIEKAAVDAGVDISAYEVIDEKDRAVASLKAVALVSDGEASIVMKGLVDTSIILKAVLNKEVGLRTGNLLSHVAVFDVPSYHKILLVTDAAMNIEPSLEDKVQIIENSLSVSRALDIEVAKVAAIAAKEKVSEKMKATVDAGELAKMSIEGCIVGGPFGLDNAVSKEAARIKGIDHEVAGDADILLAPRIEAGNVLYKTLGFLCESKSAGIIVGAKAPIVLTSRADSDESKFNSIALSVLMASKM